MMILLGCGRSQVLKSISHYNFGYLTFSLFLRITKSLIFTSRLKDEYPDYDVVGWI